MKEEEEEVEINIITLGECGVGKTSIIKRIKFGKFEDNIKGTLAVDYFIVKKKYADKNIMISLKYNDTNGQEEMQGIIPVQYIRDSQIVLLVFCNIDTLNKLIQRWDSFYKEYIDIKSKFILIGNKSDIFGENKNEIERQGGLFAEKIDAHFITCSAKSADNMDNLENYIFTEAKNYIKKNVKNINKKTKLGNTNTISNNKKRKCC